LSSNLRTARFQTILAVSAALVLASAFGAMAHLGDLSVNIPEFMALALGIGIVYFVALFALEHTLDTSASLWIIFAGALVFRLLLFPHPPSLSTDVHRYRWDGHVQQAGWNPYAIAPTDSRLKPLRDPGWYVMPAPEIPTMYPPLSELVFRATWRLLPDPVGFKTPFLLADLAVLAMLAGWIRSTGGRNYQIAVYAWNPLVIVEFASSGHNDALALAAVVLTMLIIRRYPVMSTLALTAGALAKAFPVVLLPVALFSAGWPKRPRAWLAAGGCAVLTVILTWPYIDGWRQFLQMLRYYRATWRNYNSSIYPVLLWVTHSHGLAAGVGEAVVAGLALWLALRGVELKRAAFLLIGTVLLFAPNGYSWYFTWIVPLLCFYPSAAWLLLTVLQFLSYKIFINYRAYGDWHFDPFFQWLTYAPFFAMLLWEILRAAGRHDSWEPAMTPKPAAIASPTRDV
jgi:alpha-1,6-mannosyltransferase